MGITDLIPGVDEIKLALAGVMAAAVLGGFGWVVWEYHDLKTMKQENTVLIQNNKILQENDDILKGNLAKAQTANATDQATIQSLIKERNDAQTAIANLAKQKQSDVATIGALGKKLKDMEGNTANDGPLAPDLRETIRGIQGGSK
jgi:seryl-tRNA synthetase